jgi:hypothetical protein
MLSEDETKYVKPYYLKMMGLNAIWEAEAPPIRDVQEVSESVSDETVLRFLRGEWRPRVMGAWFALTHAAATIGADLARSMETCGGSLTAPPLAVSAATVLGREAVPSLMSYATGDVGKRDSSNRFVAAVLESLGQSLPGSSNRCQRSRVSRADALGRHDNCRLRRELTRPDSRR